MIDDFDFAVRIKLLFFLHFLHSPHTISLSLSPSPTAALFLFPTLSLSGFFFRLLSRCAWLWKPSLFGVTIALSLFLTFFVLFDFVHIFLKFVLRPKILMGLFCLQFMSRCVTFTLSLVSKLFWAVEGFCKKPYFSILFMGCKSGWVDFVRFRLVIFIWLL